jgi:hypothetical protein
LRRFCLTFTMWGEPHPPLTSVLAEPHIVPYPVTGSRAPDHVPSGLSPFLNSATDRHSLRGYRFIILAFSSFAETWQKHNNNLPHKLTLNSTAVDTTLMCNI